MKIKKLTLKSIPERVRVIPDAPRSLYTLGPLESLLKYPTIAIVGSRKASPYGREVTYTLASELAAAGFVVISGLALGIDGIAHQAALDAKGKTVAVLPTGLDRITPIQHQKLAEDILNSGGALVSEYEVGSTPQLFNFIARNRIVSGLADAVLITEAAEKSGTMHTANFALNQGKTVFVVPGSITNPNSTGTNNLLKVGATPVTKVEDIFDALGISKTSGQLILPASKDEATLTKLLKQGIADASELQFHSKLSDHNFNHALTMMEVSGKIKALGANQWRLK